MSVAIRSLKTDFSAHADHELFLIGDIHGHADLLKSLLEACRNTGRAAGKQRVLVFLGDLIDRGPDSLGCLDLAIQAQDSDDFDHVLGLMGNHEQFLAIALSNPDTEKGELAARNWLRNGGAQVVQELCASQRTADLDIPQALGQRRIAWLNSLASHFISGQILAVHAGLNPDRNVHQFLKVDWDVSFSDFSESDHWAWIRGPFLSHVPDGMRGHQGFFVIHGHTPQPSDPVPLEEQPSRCRLNLDGGSYATGKARMARIVDNEVTLFEAS